MSPLALLPLDHGQILLLCFSQIDIFFSTFFFFRDIPATLRILTGPPTTSSLCPTQETMKSSTVSVQPQERTHTHANKRTHQTMNMK